MEFNPWIRYSSVPKEKPEGGECVTSKKPISGNAS